ncbi:hypothetical protein PENTCL1PPCAC_29257, partial [Pristionchus entomophagus]
RAIGNDLHVWLVEPAIVPRVFDLDGGRFSYLKHGVDGEDLLVTAKNRVVVVPESRDHWTIVVPIVSLIVTSKSDRCIETVGIGREEEKRKKDE